MIRTPILDCVFLRRSYHFGSWLQINRFVSRVDFWCNIFFSTLLAAGPRFRRRLPESAGSVEKTWMLDAGNWFLVCGFRRLEMAFGISVGVARCCGKRRLDAAGAASTGQPVGRRSITLRTADRSSVWRHASITALRLPFWPRWPSFLRLHSAFSYFYLVSTSI